MMQRGIGVLWVSVEVLGVLILAAITVPFGIIGTVIMWMLTPLVAATTRLTGRAAGTPPPDVALGDVDVRKLLGKSNANQRAVDGVFEGGGVKAIAQIGAVAAAHDLKLKWRLLGGTSGGAIIAGLLACGKSPQEIWQLLTEEDLSRILQAPYLPRVRALRRRKYFVLPLLPTLLWSQGAVSGDVFLRIMREHLTDPVTGEGFTFGHARKLAEMIDPDETEPNPLKIVATDASRGRPIVLPDDLPQYWEPWIMARERLGRPATNVQEVQDCFPVADAVRMSMSIPFVFAPYRMHLNGQGPENAATEIHKGDPVEIVDGGVSSNFPIWIFDRKDGLPPTRPTFGFLLDESRTPTGENPEAAPRIWSVVALLRHVIDAGMGAMDKRLSEHNERRTIRLRTCGVSTTDFGLAVQRQRELYQAGYEDAAAFFRSFDWDEYVRKFRGGTAYAAGQASARP